MSTDLAVTPTPKFFTFHQNNSGGRFDEGDGVAPHVIIEAMSAKEANEKAKSLGIYFDGVDEGIDCPCCGDRWDSVDDRDGTPEPRVYGRHVSEIERLQWGKEYEIVVHRMNGLVEYFPAKEKV